LSSRHASANLSRRVDSIAKGVMLKDKLRDGRACLGAWILGTAIENAEVLAASGLDFLVFDSLGGQGDLDAALAQFRAIKSSGCAGLVRLRTGDPGVIARALDGGAAGIMVANVGAVDEARKAVSACRAGGAVVAIELEAAGIERIEEVCAVEGVDLVFLGSPDPAARLRAEQAVLRAGKRLGGTALDGKTAAGIFAAGYALVVAGSDTTLLGAAAASMLAEVRAGETRAGEAVFVAPPSLPRYENDWTATTSIRRMRRFWTAWCVAVLLLGIAVVGFGYLFSISEDWSAGYRIGGRILAGLIATWAIYDAHRMAVHGTVALQEVLAQNLATMVATELERLKAATDARRRSLAAKGAGVVAALGDAERIGLELPTCRFDNEGVRTLLGNPIEQALSAVLEAIEEYNRLIHAGRDRALSQSELARRIDAVFDSVNLAMASVIGGPGAAAGKSLSMTH
jgi:2-keto-3-deoxy-L-rhamnonate aldolase RhmA